MQPRRGELNVRSKNGSNKLTGSFGYMQALRPAAERKFWYRLLHDRKQDEMEVMSGMDAETLVDYANSGMKGRVSALAFHISKSEYDPCTDDEIIEVVKILSPSSIGRFKASTPANVRKKLDGLRKSNKAN